MLAGSGVSYSERYNTTEDTDSRARDRCEVHGIGDRKKHRILDSADPLSVFGRCLML